MDLDILGSLDSAGRGREIAAQRELGRAARQGTAAEAVDRTSKLYQACVDFEAIFLKQMLTAMRKTVPKDGLLDGGLGREIYEDMLYDEYASTMARTAGFGLADSVYRYLTTTQAAAIGL